MVGIGRVAYTLPAGKVITMQLFILWLFASIGIAVYAYGLYEIIVNDITI